MASLVLKSMIPNLDLDTGLNCSFELLQKCNLNQPVWNFLVSINEVIYHVGPLHPPEEEAIYVVKPLPFPRHPTSPKRRYPGLKIMLPFLLRIAPLPYPSSYKNLPFCTTPQITIVVAGWDADQFMNRLIKPTRSPNFCR